MGKRVIYGAANYAEIVEANGYFVDKTHYIPKLELVGNPIFLRPRRFGKSLWCRVLELYYSISEEQNFERLFGHTYIGQKPTRLHNALLTVHFDFSSIEPSDDIARVEQTFHDICNLSLRSAVRRANRQLNTNIEIDLDQSVLVNLKLVLTAAETGDFPPLYIIIDEYDNFANQLVTRYKDQLYAELTADDGLLKTFFKVLKEGRKTGAIHNVFITGVLPILIDDLASAFNIGTFLTLDPEFEAMLGFTQTEVDGLLDEIYRDYVLDPTTRDEVEAVIKTQYDGYHFAGVESPPLYNPTLLLYFLRDFTRFKAIPEFLTDANLRTDLSWVRRLTGSNPQLTNKFVEQLTTVNQIAYDRNALVTKFDMRQFFEPSFFPISFFHLGMLTRRDQFTMQLPNLNMRQIFVEYFNELHHIDVSTRYAEMMQRFVDSPNLEQLFADYWRLYVSQLPEAIFTKMNENFYRTTFYELCSRYLSAWFTWNVERSYPSGRSDLEFVGKYHEKFAGLRWVIEFKYYANADFKRRFHTTIDAFTVQEEDTIQIAGYVEGLRQEYPEARITKFVIYCIGNQGFRVFAL